MEVELEKMLAQGAVDLKNNGFVATQSSPPSGDSSPSPVTPAPRPPCHEEPSSPAKRPRNSPQHDHQDEEPPSLGKRLKRISHQHHHKDKNLEALERLLDGKELTSMQPPSVPINVMMRSGTKVLWPDGSLTDEKPSNNEAGIVSFADKGQEGDLLSDEEVASFEKALEGAEVFMQQHHAGIKKSLVEAEKWSLLTCIQNTMDVLNACSKTKPSSRSTARKTLEWICSNLRAHPGLCPCANELIKWNCPQEPWMAVQKKLETHRDEVKALLVEKEKWMILSQLTTARAVMASTVANGQAMADNDRSLVQDSVQAIKDLVAADDDVSVLHKVVEP